MNVKVDWRPTLWTAFLLAVSAFSGLYFTSSNLHDVRAPLNHTLGVIGKNAFLFAIFYGVAIFVVSMVNGWITFKSDE